MRIEIHATPESATLAAADWLSGFLTRPESRSLMVAGGNTPLKLYAEIARRRLQLPDLVVHILDEYVGVPMEDARTCSQLLRRTVRDAWRISHDKFHTLSSLERDAAAIVVAHEQRIEAQGGLDAIVLGLGQNGHLGFNEPGSAPGSSARVLDLTKTSIEANRVWFGGEHAPAKAATVGMKTILGARHALLLAFGEAKAEAVRSMVRGARTEACPASWLQEHAEARIFLDEKAACLLS